MGLVKEPKGVDFVIKSRPLKKQEKIQLSEFIREQKAKYQKKVTQKKAARKRAVTKKKRAVA